MTKQVKINLTMLGIAGLVVASSTFFPNLPRLNSRNKSMLHIAHVSISNSEGVKLESFFDGAPRVDKRLSGKLLHGHIIDRCNQKSPLLSRIAEAIGVAGTVHAQGDCPNNQNCQGSMGFCGFAITQSTSCGGSLSPCNSGGQSNWLMDTSPQNQSNGYKDSNTFKCTQSACGCNQQECTCQQG